MKKDIIILDKKLAIQKDLEKHQGKMIVQGDGLLKHISKHKKEYISINSYEYTINNIASIVKKPDYIYYNKDKNGLEFYKKLKEYVCVVVKISNKRELYIASVYPVEESKISNRKYKDSYSKYVISENDLNKDSNF